MAANVQTYTQLRKCSYASVGLAQARRNYASRQKPKIGRSFYQNEANYNIQMECRVRHKI